jgi:hypothetical protein
MDLNRESVQESEPLNVEIETEGLHLVRQRNLVSRVAFETHPQQRSEIANHIVRTRGIGVHERRNQVQRIKQEMWLQLALQDLQLGFRQLTFELGRAKLGVPRAEIIVQAIEDPDDDPVHPQIPGHALPELETHETPRGARHIFKTAVGRRERNPGRRVEQQNQDGERAVCRDPESGLAVKTPDAFAEKQNDWREHAPDCVVDDGEASRVTPGNGLSHHGGENVVVYRQQSGKVAPGAGDHCQAAATTPGTAGSGYLHQSSLTHSSQASEPLVVVFLPPVENPLVLRRLRTILTSRQSGSSKHDPACLERPGGL